LLHVIRMTAYLAEAEENSAACCFKSRLRTQAHRCDQG
jgi:hypothetical protein